VPLGGHNVAVSFSELPFKKIQGLSEHAQNPIWHNKPSFWLIYPTRISACAFLLPYKSPIILIKKQIQAKRAGM
jgi:hypothetical protein